MKIFYSILMTKNAQYKGKLSQMLDQTTSITRESSNIVIIRLTVKFLIETVK